MKSKVVKNEGKVKMRINMTIFGGFEIGGNRLCHA